MGGAVTVIGGTYRERCTERALNRLAGSGLRAAGILRSLGRQVEFTTLLDAEQDDEAKSVAATLDISLVAHTRPAPVTFSYDTPLSPARWHTTEQSPPVVVKADVVLGFGMVETDWSATAATLILDPQHAHPHAILARTTSDRCALVLNEHETQQLTHLDDVAAGARALLSDHVDVVIVKQGAIGGLVVTQHGTSPFGAIPTASVHAIGSGDAFTAGFAHAWSLDPTAPGRAAAFASRVAAAHSLTGTLQIPSAALASLPETLPHPGPTRPRVYLAGPFFSVAERQLVRQVRDALQHLGVAVFSPFHDVGLGGDEVATRDLAGLRGCHSVLALLDGADPGTLFEVGWATHANLPVVALAESPERHEWTMLRGTDAQVTNDLTVAAYHAAWAAVRQAAAR